MKKSALKFAAVAAMVVGFAAVAVAEPPATEWTYSGGKLISSDGWSFAVTVKNGAATIGRYSATGTSTELNFRTAEAVIGSPIKTFNGTFYLNSYTSASSIEKVWLPLGLTRIEANTFRNLSNLELVDPLIPDGVTYLGDRVFTNDGKLTGTLVLGGNGQNVTFNMQSSGGYHFGSCAITNIIVHGGVSSLGVRAFLGCHSVKDVEFLGYATWDSTTFGGGNAKGVWQDFQARFIIPLVSIDWDNFIAANSATAETAMNHFTPWDESTMGDAYRQKFGKDAKAPLGLVNIYEGKTHRQYVVRKDGELATKTLNVTANPKELGEVVPDYGSHADVSAGLPLACSASRFASDGDTYYECVKYRLETLDVASGAYMNPREEDGYSFEYNPTASGVERLTWLWQSVGYRPYVLCPAEGGTIAFDPQPTLGDGQFYPRNTTVTITATPAAGRRFVRWYGDVDESVCSNATISVTMDGELRLIAYFDTPWVVAEGNESMSDGYWTIPVSGYPDAMKLGADKLGGTTYPDARMPMELDLAKPIVGGGTITSLSDFFVGFQNTEDYRLRRVVLPGTLCHIGYSAFRNCCALNRVEPFFPQSLNYLGAYSFARCLSLKMSDLTLAGTPDAGLSVPMESSSAQYNQLNSVIVTNVTFGEHVTTYPMGAMPIGVKEVRYLGANVNISNTGLNQYARIYFAHKPTYADGNFSKWTAYGSRIYVGNGDQAWMDYVNDSANVTRWADLDESVRAKFEAAEGERHPFGLFKETAFAPGQWVFIWKQKQGVLILVR